MLRIGVIPVLFFLLLSPGPIMSLVIAVLFIAAALTDLMDGYIARKYQIVTTMGKFLDPIADKLIVNTAMILLIPIGRIPAWIVAIIVIRDFAVDGMRNIASSAGDRHPGQPIGKAQNTLSDLCRFRPDDPLLLPGGGCSSCWDGHPLHCPDHDGHFRHRIISSNFIGSIIKRENAEIVTAM